MTKKEMFNRIKELEIENEKLKTSNDVLRMELQYAYQTIQNQQTVPTAPVMFPTSSEPWWSPDKIIC